MPHEKSVELQAYFQTRSPQILEAMRACVEIESPSNDVAGSREIAAWIKTQAQSLRCVDTLESELYAASGEHLILRAFQNSAVETPQIFFLGHTDTVHPRGSLNARPFRVDGDKIYAPGIFDMKANVALLLEILRACDVLNLQPSRGVTILLSCDEEIGSNTGRELVEREARRAGFCLVCEPSANGKVKTGRKGTAGFKIAARGIPAHAGLEPERGANAIAELARQIPAIHALNAPEIGTTVNVCRFNGGTASNVIPEHAALEIDVRFTTMNEAARVIDTLNNLQVADGRVRLHIEGGLNRPPLERNAEVIALYERARQIAVEMNYVLDETQVGGASDGNFVAALGVPVLDGLGLKGDGAHTNHEFIYASDIVPRAALLTRLLLSL